MDTALFHRNRALSHSLHKAMDKQAMDKQAMNLQHLFNSFSSMK